METRIVACAIIEHKGKILFGKKPKGIGPYPNTWHLIGGGINPEESVIDAVKREVKEEAVIIISNIKPISFDEDYEPNKHKVMTHYIFLVFKAAYKSGKIRPDDDISELKWIKKSELSSIRLNRPTIRLFKKLKYIQK